MIVVFEGIDRSGKSSRLNKIYDTLHERGYTVETQAFPTKRDIMHKSEFIQDMSNTMNRWINTPYYAPQECIRLVDRYIYSTMAYQDDLELKIPLTVPKPDFGIFFNISPQHSYGKELSYEIFDMDKVFSNYQTIVKEGIFKPKHGWLKITKDTSNEHIINHILRVKSLKEGQNIIGG